MHWPEIERLAGENSDKANQRLGVYFLEAQRLTSEQVCKRTVETEFKIGAQNLDKNRDVLLLLVCPNP